MVVKLKTKQSKNKQKFGNDEQTGNGSNIISTPLRNKSVITERIEVVRPDATCLVGIAFSTRIKCIWTMCQTGLYVKPYSRKFQSSVRKAVSYWNGRNATKYDTQEIIFFKIHRKIPNPILNELLNMLKPAELWKM